MRSPALRILVWNLKRPDQRRLAAVADVVATQGADLLIAQEACAWHKDALVDHLGGIAAFTPAFPRHDGWEGHLLWRRQPGTRQDGDGDGDAGPVQRLALGGWPWPRVAQVFRLWPGGPVAAGVQLSHPRGAQRRQLAIVAGHHPMLIAGDCNLVGRLRLPGYRDVTPATGSFRLGPVRLRLDRVLLRDDCSGVAVDHLPHQGLSDHDALLIRLNAGA
ncbi:endonuclease/exonuclease/phosphatase family protein [Tistrella bauzanensis]|uniref:Endonuclease/exonuclease/phosphatase family protein n=1 Tax=Tistrella arctica TaxID=3133430 RepID=A0ABU9YHM1_9PROT